MVFSLQAPANLLLQGLLPLRPLRFPWLSPPPGYVSKMFERLLALVSDSGHFPHHENFSFRPLFSTARVGLSVCGLGDALGFSSLCFFFFSFSPLPAQGPDIRVRGTLRSFPPWVFRAFSLLCAVFFLGTCVSKNGDLKDNLLQETQFGMKSPANGACSKSFPSGNGIVQFLFAGFLVPSRGMGLKGYSPTVSPKMVRDSIELFGLSLFLDPLGCLLFFLRTNSSLFREPHTDPLEGLFSLSTPLVFPCNGSPDLKFDRSVPFPPVKDTFRRSATIHLPLPNLFLGYGPVHPLSDREFRL